MSAKKTTKPMKNAKAVAARGRVQGKVAKPAGIPTKAKRPDQEKKPRRPSALEAAAQVLKAAGKPMRAQELIDAMAAKGLWQSPTGKTPHATLYASMVREINTKGRDARFVKTERGLFKLNR